MDRMRYITAAGAAFTRLCLVVTLSITALPAASRADATRGAASPWERSNDGRLARVSSEQSGAALARESVAFAPAAGGVLLNPQAYAGTADVVISTNVMFNTDSGMSSPPLAGLNATINAGGTGLTAFSANNITIPTGATVSYIGSRALALLAKGNIVVSGTINADGAGAAGATASVAAQGPGAGLAGTGGGGGGGGSFGSLGGTGGNGNGTNNGGLPGAPNGQLDLSNQSYFVPGSGGGHGSVCTANDNTTGGAGGGGIALIAVGNVNLSSSTIRAKGGSGSLQAGGNGGNAGGSGGAVMIVTPRLVDNGTFYMLAGGNGQTASSGLCQFNPGGGAGGGGGRLTIVSESAYSGTFILLPSSGGIGAGNGTAGGIGGVPTHLWRPFVDMYVSNTGVAGQQMGMNARPAVGVASNFGWDFGDGILLDTANFTTTHTYQTPGTYTITLTLTMSGSGAQSSRKYGVIIFDAPISGLSATSSSPTVLGRTTTLSATVSSGTSVTYTWSYGDGSSGSGATTQHIYAAPGSYTASVTATNSISSTSANTSVSVLWPNYLPLLRR